MVSSRGRSLSRVRGRASRVLTTGIDELGPSARLRSEDTLPAEMPGMVQHAALDKQQDDAQTHLAKAKRIAARIGEVMACGCGSWTACVTPSASQDGVDSLSTARHWPAATVADHDPRKP
jgi:hypothetical protein